MEQLFNRIADVTRADIPTARAAVGLVLLFMRDGAPNGHIGELIDKSPSAHQAVAAAMARSDGGVTSIIAGIDSFRGAGSFDTLALEGKLANLGLDKEQINKVITEVFAHADALIGPDGVEDMKRKHPEMARLLSNMATVERQSATAPRDV